MKPPTRPTFPSGTPRICTRRERVLWLDGWNDGFSAGVEKGRRLERRRLRAKSDREATR